MTKSQQNEQPRTNGYIPKTYHLRRLNQEETENLHSPSSSNEIDLLIKSYQKLKSQDQMDSQGNSTRHLNNS